MDCTLEVKIASRGYHLYGKSTWSNPKKGECLIAEQRTDPVALLEDPYAIAWKLQKKDKLVPVVAGHIPREISRFVWYIIKYGGKVCSQVHSERPRLSPIQSGAWPRNITDVKTHNFRLKAPVFCTSEDTYRKEVSSS